MTWSSQQCGGARNIHRQHRGSGPGSNAGAGTLVSSHRLPMLARLTFLREYSRLPAERETRFFDQADRISDDASEAGQYALPR
jgi:hypothetical protein